jgi:hypothetical protein
VISTSFTVPETFLAGGIAELSFDYWNRKGSGLIVSLWPDVELVSLPIVEPINACDGEENEGETLCLLSDDPVERRAPEQQPGFDDTITDNGAQRAWMPYQRSLNLIAGARYTLSFEGIGGRSSGAHIDQVSLRVETGNRLTLLAAEPIPAPAPLAMLAMGLTLLGLGRVRKARNTREA